ncbi:MAG: ABC transporter substrate-binding protein [Chloroflexota bacterium]|nr:ABC transporter substrate-binding protein [Chloroflexota bacterium]
MTPWRRLTLASGVAALFFSACTSGASPSTAPTTAPVASASVAPSASVAAAADVCTKPDAKAGTSLTFVSYGGVYQKAQRQAWLEPYAKLTGVKFTESEDSSNATVKAQVESGQVTWDVVDVGNDFGLEANKDVLEPLDFSLIHKDEILPGFVGPYRVADITYGVVLAYRTDKTAGQTPQGWADFFDLKKFPGKRGMYDYSAGGIFEVALMADGVAPKDLYPLDIPRAIKKLDTIKDQLVFWPGGAKSQELIGSGEVTMSLMWNGRAWSAKNIDNKPVAIQWNQQLLTSDYLVVPKGDPNKAEAMKFIAWATCAQNNAGPSQYIPYGPTNKNSKPQADKVPDLAVSNVNDTTAYFDDTWIVTNAKALDDAYNAWKTK